MCFDLIYLNSHNFFIHSKKFAIVWCCKKIMKILICDVDFEKIVVWFKMFFRQYFRFKNFYFVETSIIFLLMFDLIKLLNEIFWIYFVNVRYQTRLFKFFWCNYFNTSKNTNQVRIFFEFFSTTNSWLFLIVFFKKKFHNFFRIQYYLIHKWIRNFCVMFSIFFYLEIFQQRNMKNWMYMSFLW